MHRPVDPRPNALPEATTELAADRPMSGAIDRTVDQTARKADERHVDQTTGDATGRTGRDRAVDGSGAGVAGGRGPQGEDSGIGGSDGGSDGSGSGGSGSGGSGSDGSGSGGGGRSDGGSGGGGSGGSGSGGGRSDGSAGPAPPTRSGTPFLMTLLIFAFGIVAGVLLAFSGAGFFADGASALVLVFILALLLVGGGGALLFGFRRPILRSLFGYAETQVEMFADPLARVARRAIAGDPDGATSAARELVGLTLARYSWVTTRRWIVASLTALIAAMAALAGTALLFRQNQLLEAQSALFADQNAKIEDQSRLLVQQVELAEAARNAALAVEITSIAARIGAVAEGVQQRHADAMQAEGMTVDPYDSLVNVLDPVTDLDQELILRIVSVSRATRPYRFLEQGLRAGDPRDKMRVAMQRRRADLPQTYARLAESNGWQDSPAVAPLTDRPLSPERGQLLTVLVGGGIRNLELLNHFGLDLSFASLPDGELSLLTAQGALLSYANFDGAALNSADLGGGFLDNFRCRRCRIEASTFAAVTADRLRPPMPPAGVPITTQMAGADFGSAVIIDTGFAGANMLAASFDGALLAGVDFSGASLGAASFRGAVLVGTRFEGADLKAVDFDGAVMFSPDPLAELAAAAPEGRFSRDRYSAAPITMDDVMDVPVVYTGIDAEDVATRSGGAPAFRLTREQPFAD